MVLYNVMWWYVKHCGFYTILWPCLGCCGVLWVGVLPYHTTFSHHHQLTITTLHQTSPSPHYTKPHHHQTTHGVVFDQNGGFKSQFLFLLNVIADVTQLLLHYTHGLKVRRVVEGVTTQQQQLDLVGGDCWLVMSHEFFNRN